MAGPHHGVCLLGLRCPERLSQRISISYIMVYSNLPRPYHDANLGLSSIPSITQCPLCSKPDRGCRFSWSQPINQHCSNGTRGHCYSRNWLFDRFHDFIGLHIPPHDAEAPAGHAETRHLHVYRSLWLYRCWHCSTRQPSRLGDTSKLS